MGFADEKDLADVDMVEDSVEGMNELYEDHLTLE